MEMRTIGKTESAYRFRLDDLSCDEEGCERAGEFCIMYATDNPRIFFHQIWCDEHEETLAPGSVVFEGEEESSPADPEDD